MRPNKHKHQGLEQTKVYFRVSSKKNRWFILKRPKLKDGFQEFLKAIFGMRATGYVTFFWLIGG